MMLLAFGLLKIVNQRRQVDEHSQAVYRGFYLRKSVSMFWRAAAIVTTMNCYFTCVLSLIALAGVKLFDSAPSIIFLVIAAMLAAPLSDKYEYRDDAKDE
jgi:ABC-type transport system involved in cytochrome c biogenesis permease component